MCAPLDLLAGFVLGLLATLLVTVLWMIFKIAAILEKALRNEG